VNDLRQGQEWKRQLYRWIARCDAGFLLLTREVMDNPGWVLQEATLLRARQIYEGARFPLFVMVEPAARTHENWAKLFGPLALAEMQRTDFAATPQDIAKEVADGCKALAEAGDYFSMLRGLLADKLSPFAGEANLLKRLQGQLDVADADWHAVIEADATPAGSLALALTTRLCEDNDTAIGSFTALDDLFSNFQRRAQREDRENLLFALAPYWVNLGAAMNLAVALHQPPGQRLCALRTSRAATVPELYVDRMFMPLGGVPIVIRVTGGNESAAELEAQVLLGWNERMSDNVGATADLNAKLKPTRRFIVVLPPLDTPVLARAVAALFPLLTFLVPVAPDVDLGHPDWRGFKALEPVRAPETEADLVNSHDIARAYL